MRLGGGFRVAAPAVLVPWGIGESELLALLPDRPRLVTDGYYTLPVVSLGGISHDLGFHFKPRRGGRLVELEFFRRTYTDLAASYREWQEHLEDAFGPPHTREPGDEGFDACRWFVDGVHITHLVFDRFGPEEHVRIRRP